MILPVSCSINLDFDKKKVFKSAVTYMGNCVILEFVDDKTATFFRMTWDQLEGYPIV